jgi:hypothetical protein
MTTSNGVQGCKLALRGQRRSLDDAVRSIAEETLAVRRAEQKVPPLRLDAGSRIVSLSPLRRQIMETGRTASAATIAAVAPALDKPSRSAAAMQVLTHSARLPIEDCRRATGRRGRKSAVH